MGFVMDAVMEHTHLYHTIQTETLVAFAKQQAFNAQLASPKVINGGKGLSSSGPSENNR
jgi:hypothetical protein